ncbi:MAG: alpha/beta fold hydrolase [Ardenticatenales bacterium]|nr:alpha/beta fold hydrolase [Ardenticatenales bacterium]
MSVRMIETAVGGLKVRVEGDAPGRATAVLWHSLFVDERTWDRVVPDLAQDRRLVIITGPGHGASGDPGRRYTMEDCAEAAIAVLNACAITDPVDWVGNAWGGHVGLVLAARRPELVRTLITAGTPVHPYKLPARLQMQLGMLPLYRLVGPVGSLTTAVVEALLSESTRAHDAAATGLVRECFTGSDRARMANAVVSISLRREDLTPLLGSVHAPTLFLTGSAHPDWSPEQARAAAARLPQGSSAVVDDAAYLLPLEAPTAFNRLVRQFWAQPTTPGGFATRSF